MSPDSHTHKAPTPRTTPTGNRLVTQSPRRRQNEHRLGEPDRDRQDNLPSQRNNRLRVLPGLDHPALTRNRSQLPSAHQRDHGELTGRDQPVTAAGYESRNRDARRLGPETGSLGCTQTAFARAFSRQPSVRPDDRTYLTTSTYLLHAREASGLLADFPVGDLPVEKWGIGRRELAVGADRRSAPLMKNVGGRGSTRERS